MRLPYLAVAGVLMGNAFAAPNECDRACLKTTLDQYLNAVIKHDPSAAPLSAGFRETDDAVVVRAGMGGVWKSVTGLGKLQRHYVDPVTGQAAYFGTVEEGAGEAIVTVRVKVENRKITEAEWLIARNGDPGLNGPRTPDQPGNFFRPDYLASNPPREKLDPKQARSSREGMLGATNSYFDGITTHDGSIIMAHPGCVRIENGAPPGSGRGAAASKDGGTKAPATDCTSGLGNINVQLVAARRYPVVDEEAGVVLAIAVFVRKPGTTTRRNMFSEWFTIDDNKIRTIYSAMFYPAPELPVPNWPPYEGNWPLPPTFTAAAPAPQR